MNIENLKTIRFFGMKKGKKNKDGHLEGTKESEKGI